MTDTTFLTPDQVLALNEKHGWFHYADAQGDVSRAFAQDAIALHERIRQAAPEMHALLTELYELTSLDNEVPASLVATIRTVLAKANGS